MFWPRNSYSTQNFLARTGWKSRLVSTDQFFGRQAPKSINSTPVQGSLLDNLWPSNGHVRMACFLAHNGLPHHLALQWMGVRGVLCNKREFEIAWHKTLQGGWSDNAFTWDNLKGKYCYLNNGQERCIPDDKCNKPQQGSR